MKYAKRGSRSNRKFPRKKSSKNGNRFLTSLDMAEAKRVESIYNSMVKRGILSRKHTYISVCGCGSEGCIICSEGVTRTKRKTLIKKIKTLSIDEFREKLKENQ